MGEEAGKTRENHVLIRERERGDGTGPEALARFAGGPKKRREWIKKKEKRRRRRGRAKHGKKGNERKERESWFGQAYKPDWACNAA